MNNTQKLLWLLLTAGAAAGIFFLIQSHRKTPRSQNLAGDTPGTASSNTVRVAAIQCYSRMGEIDYNRKLLTGLIEKAAGAGAKIIVLPECALTGYMDPANDIKWTSRTNLDANEMDANRFAETVPGTSTEYFGQLAKKLQIYLCISLIEKNGSDLHNAQVLLDPDGKICLHHRKTILWQPGDGLWAREGSLPVRVIDTKYGRVGMMTCFEYHVLPPVLAAERAEIVLYSVGWYAPNPETWFSQVFPRNTVAPNGFSVIVANWSADEDSPGWPGHGCSCIIDRTGKVLVMAKKVRGNEIVIADLPAGQNTINR